MLRPQHLSLIFVLVAAVLVATPLAADGAAPTADLEAMLAADTAGGCQLPNLSTDAPADSRPALDLEEGHGLRTEQASAIFLCGAPDFWCGGCPSGTECSWKAIPVNPTLCCSTGLAECRSDCVNTICAICD